MQISTRTYSAELPGLFRRLFEILPKALWRRRANELNQRINKNPFLSDYFDDQFTIERELARVLSYHSQRGKYPEIEAGSNAALYEVYAFVSTLVRIYPRLSVAGRHRLRGCLRDGLANGLTSLALEMGVAVHLWNGGYDVEFTDLENRAQFDFLASKDGMELEVDCKTASGDVGRPIHRLRAIELFHRLEPALGDFLLARLGGWALRIQIPGRLHGHEEYMQSLAALIIRAIDDAADTSANGIGTVRISEFELEQGPFSEEREPSRDELGRFMMNVLGNANPHMISLHRPRESAVIAVIESEKPDKVVDGVYRSLKDSARRQFTGKRPALLAVRLTDLTQPQLADLGAREENGLAAIANHLFSGETRKHLFGLAFLARASIVTPVTTHKDDKLPAVENRGSAVLFRRNSHPMADDPRLNVLRLFSS